MLLVNFPRFCEKTHAQSREIFHRIATPPDSGMIHCMNPRFQIAAFVTTIVLFLSCGIVSTHAQTIQVVVGASQGPGTPAQLDKPFAIAFDLSGDMYIGEYGGCRVRKLDSKGVLTTLAGTGAKGFGGDGGPAGAGQFNQIHDVVVGPDGNVYVADSANRRVRKIDLQTGLLGTVAGTGEAKIAGDGGPAIKASLDGVASLWFDPTGGTLYLAGFSKVVRSIDLKTGIITTIKDLPGGRSIAVDSKGSLYIAGGTTLRVRTPGGQTRVLLDKTHLGGSDLPLADNPKHLAIDADDNVIICDEAHDMIRKYMRSDGRLITLVGTGPGKPLGAGGQEVKPQLNRPHGVFVVPATGVLYIADSWNDRVVKVAP